MPDDRDRQIMQRGLAEIAEHEGEQKPPVFVELEQTAERIAGAAYQRRGGHLPDQAPAEAPALRVVPAYEAAGEAGRAAQQQVEQDAPAGRAVVRRGGLLSLAEDAPGHARGVPPGVGGQELWNEAAIFALVSMTTANPQSAVKEDPKAINC